MRKFWTVETPPPFPTFLPGDEADGAAADEELLSPQAGGAEVRQ